MIGFDSIDDLLSINNHKPLTNCFELVNTLVDDHFICCWQSVDVFLTVCCVSTLYYPNKIVFWLRIWVYSSLGCMYVCERSNKRNLECVHHMHAKTSFSVLDLF